MTDTESIRPEDKDITPKLKVEPNGAVVHTASFSGTNGPTFSPAQRNDIAQQVGNALIDSDDEHMSANVPMWVSERVQEPPFVIAGGDDKDSVFDDEAWVLVGAGGEMDLIPVPKATEYVYKKEDAVKPTKGWFGRVFYKSTN